MYNILMTRNSDVIVIGGGVIGLTTAYFLARDGASVLICDQGKTGMESSWAGAGILAPSNPATAQHPIDRLRAISGQLFPALSAELRSVTGIDNGFFRCGAIVFQDDEHPADPHEWFGDGVPCETLSQASLQKLEPAVVHPAGATALHVPAASQLRNPWHMQALRAACESTRKVGFLEDAAVISIDTGDGPLTPNPSPPVGRGEDCRVKGVRTKNEVLSGGSFLVAAGAWTDQILAPLGVKLRIEPVRGQIALVNPGRVVCTHILAWGPRYLVPRGDGRVLCGSTEENAGFDKRPTAAAIADLLALGVQLVPELASAVVEKTWAGLRPSSPDGLPYIGRVPGIENLYVASGHFRGGIQLSPGTAVILKESILGQPATVPTDAFRLDR
jgi:glycine oxidase